MEHNIVFGAIVDDLFRLDFLGTFYLQIANILPFKVMLSIRSLSAKASETLKFR